MNKSFINKYKPKTLDDFIYHKDIINVIKKLIKINELNILIVGESGCGKTTLINCILKDYYDSKYSNNILSINPLKEQGISYYRTDVKTFCQSISENNKKKTIVLDDIDGISEQSQQIFRNCLDKYNKNVNFIASCKNIQKILRTFQSRILIIKMNQFTESNLIDILEKIVDLENIKITEDVKKFIVKISNLSIKILINYLEKFKIFNKNITLYDSFNLCTNISYNNLISYTNYCIENDLNNAIKIIINLSNDGYSVMDILDTYFIFIKLTDIIKEEVKYDIFKLLCKYISNFYIIHEDEIELIFLTNNLIKILKNIKT